MKYFVFCFSGTYKLGLRQYVSIIYRVLEGSVCIPFNGHELGPILGDGKEQRGLGCCNPWGRKELDTI